MSESVQNKVQKMHELLLSSVWNWLNISRVTVLDISEQAMVSEYALIYMNKCSCVTILNMYDSSEIYLNIDK